MKKAFGIMTAIIIICAVAGITTLLLSISSTKVKKSTDEYLRIQAELLAQSAIEYAIMRVEGFDRRTGGCLEDITIAAIPFEIKVGIKYFNKDNQISNCPSSENTNDTILLDVNVKTINANPNSSEYISFHKRTLQRP